MQRDDSIHERLADRLANILTKLNTWMIIIEKTF